MSDPNELTAEGDVENVNAGDVLSLSPDQITQYVRQLVADSPKLIVGPAAPPPPSVTNIEGKKVQAAFELEQHKQLIFTSLLYLVGFCLAAGIIAYTVMCFVCLNHMLNNPEWFKTHEMLTSLMSHLGVVVGAVIIQRFAVHMDAFAEKRDEK